MGPTIALLGVVLGIPLGLAAGRPVWRLAAEGAAVAGDLGDGILQEVGATG